MPKNKLLRITLKTGLTLIILSIAFLAFSIFYQLYQNNQVAKNYSPEGKMIDVGGYRLHVNCVGHGQPTVILEAGGGLFSTTWQLVQHKAAEVAQTKVCSYDRVGLGWSEENPKPYSISDEVNALYNALTKLNSNKPLIYVAHSYGGFIASIYANRYPSDLAGMVLVDPNTLDFFKNNPDIIDSVHSQSKVLKIATPIGLVRWLVAAEMRSYIRLPEPEQIQKTLDLFFTSKHLRSQAKMASHFGQSVQITKENTSTIQVPVIIISRGKDDNSFPWTSAKKEKDWRQSHATLAKKLANAKLISADKSDHMIIFDQPELIVSSIKNLVTQYRNKK